MFSTPPLYLTVFFPHSLPSPVSPSACISLSLSHFTPFPPPIIQSSSDGYCVSSGGECRERWGQGIRLACFNIGTRLSVSNDALIISTLALGFLTEWQQQLSGMYISLASLLACQSFFISLCLCCLSPLPFLSWWFLFLLVFAAFPGILYLCKIPYTHASLCSQCLLFGSCLPSPPSPPFPFVLFSLSCNNYRLQKAILGLHFFCTIFLCGHSLSILANFFTTPVYSRNTY